MRQNIIKLILTIALFLALKLTYGQSPETNVVYGKKHIFTIETPQNWVNDKISAQKVGLVCFFYPISEKEITNKNYMYAHGIDKDSTEETLKIFIDGDLKKFRLKYPDFTFEKTSIEFTGGLKNGILYSFSNLKDRFKEEVLYVETDDSFLIFSFAAITSTNYDNYQSTFDRFIESFNYRGNNPQPFLDYMKSKKQ